MRAIMLLLFIVPLLSSAVSAEPTDIHVDVPGDSKISKSMSSSRILAQGKPPAGKSIMATRSPTFSQVRVIFKWEEAQFAILAIGQTFEIERDVATKWRMMDHSQQHFSSPI